jgi:hypothetical protein
MGGNIFWYLQITLPIKRLRVQIVKTLDNIYLEVGVIFCI